MIDYKLKDLFWQSSVDHQLKLEFSGGDVVTNEDIYQESMEIVESLCSEQELHFGSCEASQFKIKIANSFTSHIGQTVKVSMTLDGDTENPFVFGTYKVASDKPTADRIYREITAYDVMYDILNADVSSWYDKILPNENSEVSLKAFRDSFFAFLEVEQEEYTLVNDNAKIKRTINTNEALSGKEVVCAICEINGMFGHIGRNGKFKYIKLKGLRDTLYPASDLYPSEDLYPAKPMYSTHIPTGKYKSCKYEDFECHQISKLVIREKTEDLGTIYGVGNNTYIIQGNFLVFGKGADEMSTIAKNIFYNIEDTRYLPSEIVAVGNPCLEVGDGLNLNTKYKTVYTYILQRSLKGIQALTDSFTATGNEFYQEKVNGTSRQIEQLTSRTRTLTESVEEVESKFENYSTTEQMSSAISQSATEIKTEVSKTYSTKEEVSSSIKQSADSINAEVSKKVGNNEIISKINQSAEQISINANKVNLNGYVTATDLKTGGKTTINGANITTGDISCDRLNGGTIKGQRIEGGTITGNTISGSSFIGSGSIDLGGENQNITVIKVYSKNSAPYIEIHPNGFVAGMTDTSGVYHFSKFDINTIGCGDGNTLKNYIGINGLTITSGTKNKAVKTESYSTRLLYCDETPSPIFSDMGEGITDENGECFVPIDDVFSETIDLDCQYQVFLQSYCDGQFYVSERTPTYFVVKGRKNGKFGWMLKAVQKGFDTMRLEEFEPNNLEETSTSVEDNLFNYLNEIMEVNE